MTNTRLFLGGISSVVIAVLLLSTFGYFVGFVSSAQTENLLVSSETASGSPLTGYWVEVTDPRGAMVASGFTPAVFSLPLGNYLVGAGDYGGEYFSQWSGGATSRFIPITLASGGSVSLTSVYSSSSGGSSSISVTSSYFSGSSLSGMYVALEQNNQIVATGFTPVTFSVSTGSIYSIVAENYVNAYFNDWSDGVCSSSRSVTATSSQTTLAALYTMTLQSCGSSGGGGSSNGITVSAHRIPASYWAPCFALVCGAGTGPGASMYFALYDASGNVVATGFADENGYTFTGLAPGSTYYVYAADCDLCHGSTHDVLFQYWGNNLGSTRPLSVTAGASVEAWYSCDNGCGGD